jgi:RHS repeat-associated protein
MKVERGGTVAAFHSDALGSILAVSDIDTPTGDLATYHYDPFGDDGPTTGGFEHPYGFTGRERDASGLYYYRARYYLPSIGRFLTPDPIGLGGGVNPYSYVNSNPVNFRDPFGLAPGEKGSNETVPPSHVEDCRIILEPVDLGRLLRIVLGEIIRDESSGPSTTGDGDLQRPAEDGPRRPSAMTTVPLMRVSDFLAHEISDSRASEEPEPLIEAPTPDPKKLKKCLKACKEGGEAWQKFCRGIRNKRISAVCWGLEFASEPVCRGFCYWYWGE